MIDIHSIKPGDVLRHVGTCGTFTVLLKPSPTVAIATRTIEITNPAEWTLVSSSAPTEELQKLRKAVSDISAITHQANLY